IQAAAFHRIDTLHAIMDVNRQQCDGAMSSVMDVGDIKARIETFGGIAVWVDAHNLDEIREAVKTPHHGKPLIILANSSPFRGMPTLQLRFPGLHYIRFRSERERTRMNREIARSLGIDPIDCGERC
ncbi:MAG: transketolase, partial [Rhodobacteraceae bacterium]|nr:transketolase [Paracoccaceae bacterium]